MAETPEALRAAVAAAPDDSRAWLALALLLETEGDTDGTLDACRRVLALDPRCREAWIRSVNLAEKRGELAAAEEAAASWTLALPTDTLAWSRRAGLCLARGDQTGALACLRTAVVAVPDAPVLWEMLGERLAKEGNLDEAILARRRACSLDPATSYRIGLAGLLEKRGDTEEAISILRDLSGSDPAGDGPGLREYRQILGRHDRRDDLVALESRRVQARLRAPKTPWDLPMAWEDLAGALDRVGRRGEARTARVRAKLSRLGLHWGDLLTVAVMMAVACTAGLGLVRASGGDAVVTLVVLCGLVSFVRGTILIDRGGTVEGGLFFLIAIVLAIWACNMVGSRPAPTPAAPAVSASPSVPLPSATP